VGALRRRSAGGPDVPAERAQGRNLQALTRPGSAAFGGRCRLYVCATAGGAAPRLCIGYIASAGG